MAPVYKNQNEQKKAPTLAPTFPGLELSQKSKPKTTSYRWIPDQDSIIAAAAFNSIVDKMEKDGYEYYDCIPITTNEKLLIFKTNS